jgi:hypothetical protein
MNTHIVILSLLSVVFLVLLSLYVVYYVKSNKSVPVGRQKPNYKKFELGFGVSAAIVLFVLLTYGLWLFAHRVHSP